MAPVQILETPRLILRHLVEADAPFVLELLNDPGFLANIGDRGVRDLDGARRYIDEGPGASYRANGFGLWLTALKATGEPIGICGLVKRDGLDHADVGYAILERHSGKGYATEAAAATLDYARSAIGLETILAITTLDNVPSQAVLAKIGLKPAGTIRLPGREEESAFFTS